MKILIVGDVHIGNSEHLGIIDPAHRINSRLLDYSKTLDYIIEYAKINNVDAVIFSGDYYKTRRPSNLHRKIFDSKIKELSNYGISLFLIVGNHDIVSENNTTVLDSLKIADYPNVNIYTDFDHAVLGAENDGGINLLFAPFTNKHYFNVETNEEAVLEFNKVIENMLKRTDKSLPTILVGHYMVEGVKIGSTEITKEIASSEFVVPKETFKDIDMTVMGHIHTHQTVCKDPHIFYVGSIDRNDMNDASGSKGFLEVDTVKMSAKFIKIPVRNIYDIEISSDNYLEQLNAHENLSDSIVKIDIHCGQEDVHKVDFREIRNLLKKKGVHHCVSVNIIPKKKDVNIIDTDDFSDRELFIEYVKAKYDNNKEIIKLGFEIMDCEMSGGKN